MSSEHSEENLLFWVECQDFSEVKDLAIVSHLATRCHHAVLPNLYTQCI